MTISVEIQNDGALDGVPAENLFIKWVTAALQAAHNEIEQTLRVVDEPESRSLNHEFRGKDSATNVLAFPMDAGFLDYDCLGDLVICAPLVVAEARDQGKPVEAHWAHLVVHGMLHLQGFDHRDDASAAEMEALEVRILDTLGYTNPYNE